MKPLTYKQLFEALKELTVEQLDYTVTAMIGSEFHAIYDHCLASCHPRWEESDGGTILEPQQPLLTDHIVIMSPTGEK